MDETGNRRPDKKTDASRIGRDWFGFGGVLINGEDNDQARTLVTDFQTKWKLRHPVHLTDMMAERKGFSWLGRVSQVQREEFWADWRKVICDMPAVGIGCVIDRPKYVARGYLDKHKDPWLLCRSAFDITIERATKIAIHKERRLHVVFESDPGVNSIVTDYFKNLKNNGLEFDQNNSKKYKPLDSEVFKNTLGRIEHKPKGHPLLQVADTYIYAMSRYKYDKRFWLYRSLRDRKKIAEFALPQHCLPEMSVKYYCFD